MKTVSSTLRTTALSLFLMALPFLSLAQEARSWQWIRRGGSGSGTMPQYDDDLYESGYDIATDSEQNIYVLSTAGLFDIDIDGHYLGDNYDDVYAQTDYVLASFTCDGSYRWAKIIGGGGGMRPRFIWP